MKPHAAPVFHAIQYLLGRQSRDGAREFPRASAARNPIPRAPRTRPPVDFSTGSVGLGVGMTLFASLVQDYVRLHGLSPAGRPPGRMIALMGDAELDEGNVFEALLEGWKHDVRNLWWIIDYNRQSLDGVVNDQLFQQDPVLLRHRRLEGGDPQIRQAARGRLRGAGRRGAAALDRRLPERSLFRADLPRRRRLGVSASAPISATSPASPGCSTTHDDDGAPSR